MSFTSRAEAIETELMRLGLPYFTDEITGNLRFRDRHALLRPEVMAVHYSDEELKELFEHLRARHRPIKPMKSESETPDPDRIEKALCATAKKACEQLGLYSCVIIVTAPGEPDEDGDPQTLSVKAGHGNYYAQYGSVRQWVDGESD